MEQSETPVSSNSIDFPIVGIGASAGGYEAFSKVLQHLPADTGMAFVFVQHLDPTHDSIVAELLGKLTPMWVGEATDGIRVERNHIYIIPPNKTMKLNDGHLKLESRQVSHGKHMPVDQFFTSLAEIHGSSAIGVILSGNASDGTLGMKAIKAEGGLTFAQQPGSAKFDGMPRSAISSDCVDFTLTAEQIGAELGRLGKHPYIRAREIKVDDSSDGKTPAQMYKGHETVIAPDSTEFDRICVLLKKLSGVDFKYYKDTTVRRRIARRMVVNKVEKLGEYLKLLLENRAEVEALYQDILIKVTRFFRDPDAFDFLKSNILPSIFANHSHDAPIRIWVPGCSTGEEVYTIAICLLEYMGDLASNPAIQIFATDVSALAIQSAREGKYLDNIAMDVSPERLRRFFVRLDGGYQISKPIRDLCVFAKQNMTSDPPFSKLDLISCRNVLIYLDSRLQKRVIPLFHYALKPSGYLMLGSSETIGSFGELFTLVDKHNKFYARKGGPSRMHVDFTTGYPVERMDGNRMLPDLNREENWKIQDAQRDADRIILTRYSASGVVVNPDMEIVQFRGDTSWFLEHPPGDPSFNLLKLARPGLALELRGAIHEAKSTGLQVTKDNVSILDNDVAKTVRIEVIPLHGGGSTSFFLVLLERMPKAGESPPPVVRDPGVPEDDLRRRNEQLSSELNVTKQHLQSIIEEQEATNEELQSAHEEVLSSNEELQSINEELETAKEELQSTNEELTTVNEELQNRNIELSHVNNDLTNLLSSVSIPIVMLGSDLRIRRFTPLAEKLLSLIATDIGRPISDIKPRINVPDLEGLVTEVIDTMSTRELDVQDRDGRWYSMRIRPYKTRENKIEGAVIVLLDIDLLRKSISASDLAGSDVAEMIIQTVGEPVIVMNYEFKVMAVNHAFEKVFNIPVSDIREKFIFDIDQNKIDFSKHRNLFDSVDKTQIVESEVDCMLNGKRAVVPFSLRKYETKTLKAKLIVLAIHARP